MIFNQNQTDTSYFKNMFSKAEYYALFSDVLNTINRSRNHILREKLDNVTKVFYTEEELINNVDTDGFYNSLEPNLKILIGNKCL